MELKGVYTALVTPFKNGRVDFEKIKELVDKQIEGGVDGIVPVGTTGESPTLETSEHLQIIETVIERAAGKCKIIAGTGANATYEAIMQTKEAKTMGADASLQVTPYYNKPSQEGLYRHFSEVAEIGLPVVLYNVPGRCGVPIDVETVARLSENPNIIGLKEAGGRANRVSDILSLCDISIVSGDDAITMPMMAVGAKGVISVGANLYPGAFKEMVDSYLEGNVQKAREIHFKYYDFMKGLFFEANPGPIKAAMAEKGIIEEEYRLPLCPMREKNRQALNEVLAELDKK